MAKKSQPSSKQEDKKDQSKLERQAATSTIANEAESTAGGSKTPKQKPIQALSVNDKARAFSLPLVIALFALIISILAVAESAYYWSQTHVYREQFDNRITALEGTSSVSQDQLQNLQQETQQSEQQLKSQQTVLSQTQKGLHQALALTNANMTYWTLMEASHLVRLANINLLYDQDIKGSIVLLTNAQQRLANLNDPAYVKLEQMLADNIMQLKAVPKTNTTDIVSRIDALSKEVETLPLNIKNVANEETTATKKQTTTDKSLRTRLKQTWLDLKDLIVIRHQTKPVEPLITPDQQLNLVRSIQLQLSQAQWAVLRGNEKLYQMSLQQVQDWLQKYFDPENATVKATISEATALSNIDISPKLPNLEAILQTMQKILDTQQQQTMSNKTTTTKTVNDKNNTKETTQ